MWLHNCIASSTADKLEPEVVIKSFFYIMLPMVTHCDFHPSLFVRNFFYTLDETYQLYHSRISLLLQESKVKPRTSVNECYINIAISEGNTYSSYLTWPFIVYDLTAINTHL